MRGPGDGSSVRECLSLAGNRFLVGPPPTPVFSFVFSQVLDLAGSVNGREVGECKCCAWRLCPVVVFGQCLCFSALSAQAIVCW